MPELPEVETVRRGLQPVMEGARFTKVVAHRGDLRLPLAKDFAARLEGKTVEGLGRRAKYLLADLSSGEVLVMHLGMSGSFCVARPRSKATPGRYYHAGARNAAHDHVVFHMSSGARISFNDPRRFGMMKLVARAELDREPLLRALGPEPLGNQFDAALLARACKSKKTSLRRRYRISGSWPGLATSMYVRPCTARGSRPSGAPPRLRAEPGARMSTQNGWSMRLRQCWSRRSRQAALHCAITAAPTGSSAIFSTISPSMIPPASHAPPQVAPARSGAWGKGADGHF